MAVKFPVFDESIGPVVAADVDGTIQGQLVVLFEDENGVSKRGETQLYPPALMSKSS